MTPRVDVSMSAEEIREFLGAPRVGVLSTLGPDGGPHAAAMWFAPVDDELHMWTYAKSQKAVNLRRDPRCALLVEDGSAYSELRGVLVRGRVVFVVDQGEVARIGERLFRRYVVARPHDAIDAVARGEIARQAPKRVGIVLSLSKVASWDHRKLGSNQPVIERDLEAP